MICTGIGTMSEARGDLTILDAGGANLPSTELHDLMAEAAAFGQRRRARATADAYRSDWQSFAAFCNRYRLPTTPPNPKVVSLYLTDLARRAKVSTIERHLTGIGVTYRDQGLHLDRSHPYIVEILTGIRNEKGVAPDQAAPVLLEDIQAMMQRLRPGIIGIRDRALLLTGFVGGFRRAELVALAVEDLTYVPRQGYSARLRRSKRNQAGKAEYKAIIYGKNEATCPVRALKAWLEASEIESGPVFRGLLPDYSLRPQGLNARAVARIVQHYAAEIGLPAQLYSGHSLRAGFVTQARMNGVSSEDVRQQTGHASTKQVDDYDRRRNVFVNTPARRLGL